MALETETGTGSATSESYISVADADARHTAFGNTAWTGTDAAKEAALRRATAFMEQRYGQNWKGTQLYRDQALAWPRYGATANGWVIQSTVVPVAIANACADLAVKALTETLNPDLTRAVIREKVGPLETEYSAHSPEAPRYTAIDEALSGYMKGGGSMARLVRT